MYCEQKSFSVVAKAEASIKVLSSLTSLQDYADTLTQKKSIDKGMLLADTLAYVTDELQYITRLESDTSEENVEMIQSMREFAQGVEMMCSDMLTEELILAHKEQVTSIYLHFYKLHLVRHLSESLYCLFKDDLLALLPK